MASSTTDSPPPGGLEPAAGGPANGALAPPGVPDDPAHMPRTEALSPATLAVTRRLASLRPANFGDRWLALFVMTRLVAMATAVALLVAQQVTDHDGALIIAVIGYTAISLLMVSRWPGLHDQPVAWGIDVAATFALVVAGEEWRSPFYLLALTALVLPATALRFRRALAFGVAWALAYLAIAATLGINWAALESTSRLETLSTHLMVPVLVVLALAYAADLLGRLHEERERSERFAIEAERKRIAWELHDSAKQRVHAAHLVLSLLEPRLEGAERETLDQALGELQFAVADMETSLQELRTPLVESHRLGEALRERATELERLSSARIKVAGEAQDLPPFIAAHAYRIASEAMTNAVRHAGAGQIRVLLSADAAHLVIGVYDDGRGMPDDARPGSHGLRSMRARARTIGGKLTISNGDDGRGTHVALDVPLTTAEGAPA